MQSGGMLRPVSFCDLPGWQEDDPRDLIAALRRCLRHVLDVKPYKSGSLGISSEDLLPAMQAAENVELETEGEARRFFEMHFAPFQIVQPDGKKGHVTAFYEPDVEVRAERQGEWKYPFYRPPDDLVALDDKNRPPGIDSSYAFGRLKDGKIGLYPDRRDIDLGYLEGKDLEIAWARSKEDVFFAHIQGAARLLFDDDRIKRITYAAKAGHPFSGIGRKLIDLGEVPAAEISMAAIRNWLRANPQRADEIYWHNRSYIFFREVPVGNTSLGPIAAAKVQMAPGRSLAVDRMIHTFGCPFFISSDSLRQLDDGKPFRRLMLALDTGSAIVGAARGDIFTGTGAKVGDLAGAVNNEADFFLLVPIAAAGRMA